MYRARSARSVGRAASAPWSSKARLVTSNLQFFSQRCLLQEASFRPPSPPLLVHLCLCAALFWPLSFRSVPHTASEGSKHNPHYHIPKPAGRPLISCTHRPPSRPTEHQFPLDAAAHFLAVPCTMPFLARSSVIQHWVRTCQLHRASRVDTSQEVIISLEDCTCLLPFR